MVESITNLSYEQRLKALKLPSLKYRRIRGDLIQSKFIIIILILIGNPQSPIRGNTRMMNSGVCLVMAGIQSTDS